MKTPRELNTIGQRIYWAIEHGKAGEAISELQAVQADALKFAAGTASRAGAFAFDQPGCKAAADAIWKIIHERA